MRHVLAVLSDLHAGSTVGLCTPEPLSLDDGGSYEPSAAQVWLWQCFEAFLGAVKQAKRRADQFTVLLNGDLTDGDHHNTVQIVNRNPTVEMEILHRIMAPVLALKPDRVIVVRGTEAHVGAGASTEEAFARTLVHRMDVPKDPDTGNRAWWHFRGDFDGVVVDATHHGRVGQRPWTKYSPTMSLAADIFMEHALRGEHAPHLAIRSHYHTAADSGDAYPVRVLQTPAWQLATSYAHKVVPERLPDIGGYIITIQGDAYEVAKHLYTPARPALWRPA